MHVEKSNPRAQSNTELPVSWLPAPGLEPTSTIKQPTASAGSSHSQFSAPNGRPCRGRLWLRRSFQVRCPTVALLVRGSLLVVWL